jgi:acetolactate synthase-1/3 small subunit
MTDSTDSTGNGRRPARPAKVTLGTADSTARQRASAPATATSPRSAAAEPAQTRHVPGTGEPHRHVVVAIVNNRPGVLNRVASLMRARQFNIESLAVGHTENPEISRMTITLRGDDVAVEQVCKQLYRLIDVLKVLDVTAERRIEHELALIKVRATDSNRAEILKIVELYKGRVVDVGADSLIVEATGTEEEIDALVALVGGFGIREMVRTGAIVMVRGQSTVAADRGRGGTERPTAAADSTRNQAEVEGVKG